MITIVDYGLGNIASVSNALDKLGIFYQISSDGEALQKAQGIILPGDGAAGQGIKNLKKLNLDKILIEEIKNGKPFLGICLGMQILLTTSEEGNVTCLGLIDGEVKKLQTTLKVPQIGWNKVSIINSESALPADRSRIMKNIPDNSFFYFINSYVCLPKDKSIITGSTEYDEIFCSVFEKENIFGVQFHPEKSGEVGMTVLKNFWEVVCK